MRSVGRAAQPRGPCAPAYIAVTTAQKGPSMSDDTGGLVLTPPSRNYSPWYQWMARLAATTHEDPLPEGDPGAIGEWVERRRARLDQLLGP